MAIIAIGQQIGTRAVELGNLIADELGYRFIGGPEILAIAAERYGVTTEQLLVFDERQPHFWERVRTDNELMLAILRAVILKEIVGDQVVVAGRILVPMILPHDVPNGVRIRTVGPQAARIKQVAIEESLDAAAAERRVRDSDRELRARLQSLMGAELDDPSFYHFIVNTSAKPLETIARAIAEFARDLDRQLDAAACAALRDEATIAQVRAAFLLHPKIGRAAIDIRCSESVVRLYGAGLLPPWDDLVRSVAASAAGVSRVEIRVDEAPIPPQP
jgi:cytidylate kinase